MLFFSFELEHESAPIVRARLAHEILFESLIFIAEVDDVETEVLVVFFEGFVFLLEHNEVPFESDKLHLQISLGLESLVQRNTQL